MSNVQFLSTANQVQEILSLLLSARYMMSNTDERTAYERIQMDSAILSLANVAKTLTEKAKEETDKLMERCIFSCAGEDNKETINERYPQ